MTQANIAAPDSSTATTQLFSSEIPNLQLAWDSTSYNWFQTCPRKYQLSMLEGWRDKGFAPALSFGILYHSAMELYHRLRAEGQDYEEALVGTTQFCLDKGRTLDQSNEKERSRFALVRSVVWYLDQFRNDPISTVILDNGKPAVELSFRVSLPRVSPDGAPYLWCGHIDRLGFLDETYLVTDYKSTKGSLGQSFSNRFSPSNQVTGYLYGMSQTLPNLPLSQVLIDGVELKVNFNRYMRIPASRTKAQIEEWAEQTSYWISLAEKFAMDEFWPMNLESCDKYGGCVFRENVCSKDPSVRPTWLEGSFHKSEQWNPLISREV